MTSIKCPQCGLTNWSTDVNCKRCKTLFQPEAASAIQKPTQPLPENSFADLAEPDLDSGILLSHSRTPQMVARIEAARREANQTGNYPAVNPTGNYKESAHLKPEFNHQSNNPNLPAAKTNNGSFQQTAIDREIPVKTKSGLAIASMIAAVVGFFTAVILVGFLLALVGLVLGIVALIKANKKPMIYGGKGFAIAGIVLSAVIILLIPIIAAIAIPNLLAARRSANEDSAISSIKVISSAQDVYMTSKEVNKCAGLPALNAENLIDSDLAKGEKNGYRFQVANSVSGCEINATPISASTGSRSFYFSTEEGIIRAARKNGSMADKNDMPLNGERSFR